MAAVISIISRRGLRIEMHCRNQPNKSKLALYCVGCYFHFWSHLKQLYISNKMERFSCKDGYGIRLSRYLKEELAWDIGKWL